MNRFFDIKGDLSYQLSPWEMKSRGLKPAPLFEAYQPIRFRSDVAGGVITVPIGRVSDLASIPSFAWGVFMSPDDPRIALGAWVHDEGYGSNGKLVLEDGKRVKLSRKDCDQILCHEAMLELGASWLDRWIVYFILRVFGFGWPGDTFLERFS